MTTVIGGDLALAQTGLAVWRDGDVYLRTVRTHKDQGDDTVRHSIICREVRREARPPRTLFVCEGIYHRRNFGAVGLKLAAVRGVVLLHCYAMSVPYVVLTPQNVKMLATGRGDAKKPAMMAAARDVLRLEPANDDEADAAWMMAAGLTRFPEGRAWLAERGVDLGRPWTTGVRWPTARWISAPEEVPDGTGGRGEGDGLEAAA
jgi:Holliday junction resolvasome RuvABC endonuclease subunit